MSEIDYTEHPNVRDILTSEFIRSVPYEGQLDDIDPYALGRQVRDKFGSDSYRSHESPSEKYTGGRDDDPRWEFLSNFYDKYDKGWLNRDREISRANYLKQVEAFEQHIKDINPVVGDLLLFEHSNVKGKWREIRIEFISPDQRVMAATYLTGKERERMFLLGYCNELGIFKNIKES